MAVCTACHSFNYVGEKTSDSIVEWEHKMNSISVFDICKDILLIYWVI